MLSTLKKSRGILGMNARNLDYIRPLNRKKAKRLADDKLLAKRVLRKADLPVPDLIAKITSYKELEDFDFGILPASFVLKPNFGFGGEGILIVYGKRKGLENVWVKADRSLVTEDDLRNHVYNILEGSFSRTGTPDIAFFEERVKLSKVFKPYSYKGMPDVRIIVYNKVPVMAMLRLATKESGGKANLQLGGIGCGIDVATGITTTSVQGKSKIVEYVPGTRMILSGIRIPYWNQILEMAIKAQEVSGLGFLGADIALDRDRGPVFLELNARPGLSIQIANLDGLKSRLERVKGLKVKSLTHGIKLAKNLFGGEIEEEIEGISGKKIISTVEKVKFIGKEGKEVEVEAKIDTGAYSTSIDIGLAKELGFGDLLEYFEKIETPDEVNREKGKEIMQQLKEKYMKGHEDLIDIDVVYSSSGTTIRPKVKLSFTMDNETVTSRSNIVDRRGMKYPVIIGRRDLKKFLIETK